MAECLGLLGIRCAPAGLWYEIGNLCCPYTSTVQASIALKLFTSPMQSADPGASADLAVVLMQEGLAHILLVGRRYA